MTELRITTTGPPEFRAEIMVDAARRAGPLALPILRAAAKTQAGRTAGLIHRRSGALAGGVTGTVTRKPYGFVLRVRPGKGQVSVRTGAGRATHAKYDTFYGRFVEEGTGTRGPRGRPIPVAQRGLVPVRSGVVVPTGKGQAPQRPFSRARAQYDGTVARALDEQVQRIVDDAVSAATARASR